MSLDLKIKKSRELAESVIRKYRPYVKLALVSGGNDSMALVELMRMLGIVDHVVTVDTTTGVKVATETVYRYCDQNKIDCITARTPEQSFEEIVLEHGFPGPAQHSSMYIRLKERALRTVQRRFQLEGSFCALNPHESPHKKSNLKIPLVFNKNFDQNENLTFVKEDRIIMYFTGARRSESVRRMGTVEDVQKIGNVVWVNLIADWTENDVFELKCRQKIISNPCSMIMGRSGECNCGAFGNPYELFLMNLHFPEDENVLMLIRTQADLLARGHKYPYYGHGGNNANITDEVREKTLHLCSTCIANYSTITNNI